MKDVSVIMPYCGEWPQVSFTIRSISEALAGVDFEIIVIDNWCRETEIDQRRLPDRGHDRFVRRKQEVHGIYTEPKGDEWKLAKSHIYSMAQRLPWLKYLRYDEKLSHWNAKRVGVENACSKFLWFMDAHVVPSDNVLRECLEYYRQNWKELNGPIHLPLSYHILETKRLIYKPLFAPENGDYHYKFHTFYGTPSEPFEVPCMSTCGMLIAKEYYDYIGGWPRELGIYGGGENFINYSLSVVGKRKWIYPAGDLYHHGERRGYNWNKNDYDRNRILASYLFGGEGVATTFVEKRLKARGHYWRALNEIFDKAIDQRDCIADRQVCSIKEFAQNWIEKWRKLDEQIGGPRNGQAKAA